MINVLSRYGHCQLNINSPKTEYEILASQDNYYTIYSLIKSFHIIYISFPFYD